MEALKRKIEELGLSRNEPEALLKKCEAPKPPANGAKTTKPTLAKKQYAEIAGDWIHQEAHKARRYLTHALTVSFKCSHGRDDDLKTVELLNDRDRAEVGRLAKKVPNKVFRKFGKAPTTLHDKYYFCVWPESQSKHGNPVRWHYHVELFLTDDEAACMSENMATIEATIRKYLGDYANGRQISIKFDEVDTGYNAYSSKNAISSIDMIECNFLGKGHK